METRVQASLDGLLRMSMWLPATSKLSGSELIKRMGVASPGTLTLWAIPYTTLEMADSLPGIQVLLEVLEDHVVLGDLWEESLVNT